MLALITEAMLQCLRHHSSIGNLATICRFGKE